MSRDEIWDILKANTKESYRKRMASNMAHAENIDDGNWTKHTRYHWSRDVQGHKLEYWPSTMKYKFMGKIRKGSPRKIYKGL